MRPQEQHSTVRASQPPARRVAIAAANNLPSVAFTCLVCLSLLVSILIILPR